MPDNPIDEWIDAARGVLTDLPSVGESDGVVQYTITGGPDGRVVIGVVVERGKVTALALGRVPKPDCKVSLSYEMSCRLLAGTVDTDYAFMTGGLKIEGDHALWLIGLREVRAATIEALADMLVDGT